ATAALWNAMGEFGLPQAILSDNGSAFRSNGTWRVSKFDLWLMLLGVDSLHGRPYHPQTQGKVERFHRTLERELRDSSRDGLTYFQNRYNWVSPHEALALEPPGSAYRSSSRPRPSRVPELFYPDGCVFRKASDAGFFSYQGKRYKAGIGFSR